MIQTPSGAREMTVHVPSGNTVQLIGALAGNPDSPQNRFIADGSARVAFGFGITEISADFWEKWSIQHKGFPPLEKGLVFVVPRTGDAVVEAKNRIALKTGLEGMDPDRPAPGITKETGRAI